MARSKVTDVPMALAVKIELFKRGCFDFITVKDGLKHEKQEHALKILTDNEHVELLYGGAAGGAKSWTGAVWLLFLPGQQFYRQRGWVYRTCRVKAYHTIYTYHILQGLQSVWG